MHLSEVVASGAGRREPLFITDPFEGTLAASPSGQEVIAGGLAEAIGQYVASPPGARIPGLQFTLRSRTATAPTPAG
ncbi:MAG: hypothetical protein ACLPYY_07820 [Acidimicrobiales bacterium]